MKNTNISKKLSVLCIILISLIYINFNQLIVVSAETVDLKNGGYYYIEPKCAPGKALDVKGKSIENSAIVHIWDKLPTNSQVVKVNILSNGYYKFTFIHSSKCLDVRDNASADKTRVQQYTDNGSSAQQWKIKKLSDGYYNIINKNGQLLDVDNGSGFVNGNYMQIYHDVGNSDQRFKFTEVKSLFNDIYTLPVNKGVSVITQNYSSSHLALDIGSLGGKKVDIRAIKNGTVTAIYTKCTHNYGKNPGVSCGCGGHGGNYIIIDHGSGITSTYMHLTSVGVKTGDKVKIGDVIGVMGSTGRSTGVHLHLAIKKNGSAVNPKNYIDFSKL